MAMKKVDVKKLTEDFNTLRQNHKSVPFTREEMTTMLNQIGISKKVMEHLIRKGVIITSRDGGNYHRKFYMFPQNPLYWVKLEGIYNNIREYVAASRTRTKAAKKQQSGESTEVSENELTPIEKVKLDGYKVYRQIFDIEKFKAEQPELYSSYLILEEV